MIKVLLIEDDFIWQTKIKLLLNKIGIELIGITNSVSNTLTFLETNSFPDLIIADIMLDNESVFNILNSNPFLKKTPTIIITSNEDVQSYYNSKKIENAIFLIKPIHEFTLRSSIDQLSKFIDPSHNFSPSLKFRGNNNETIFVSLSKINYIEQKGNYCHIFTDAKEFVFKKSLTLLILNLNELFIRLHKSYCLNINQAKRFSKDLQNVTLKNGIILPIGRVYRKEVKNYLSLNSSKLNY